MAILLAVRRRGKSVTPFAKRKGRATFATHRIVRDWRALAAFYERVFRCEPVPPERNYAASSLEAGTVVPGVTLKGIHLRLPCHDANGPTLEIFSSMVDQSRASIVRNSVEIVAFVSVVVADAMGLVPITQTLFLVPLIWLFLRLRNERWSTIGLYRPEILKNAIALGILAGVLLETFAVFVTTPAISALVGAEPDYSELKAVQGNLKLLLVFLGFSWVIAAFGEEVCFRGFLMKRLAQVFGEGRTAWIASLLLSSALFGWGHTEQGISGWIQEGLSGLWLGILFLATERNLTVPIVAHGVSNTLAFVLIYLGRYPGLG